MVIDHLWLLIALSFCLVYISIHSQIAMSRSLFCIYFSIWFNPVYQFAFGIINFLEIKYFWENNQIESRIWHDIYTIVDAYLWRDITQECAETSSCWEKIAHIYSEWIASSLCCKWISSTRAHTHTHGHPTFRHWKSGTNRPPFSAYLSSYPISSHSLLLSLCRTFLQRIYSSSSSAFIWIRTTSKKNERTIANADCSQSMTGVGWSLCKELECVICFPLHVVLWDDQEEVSITFVFITSHTW